MSSNLNEDLTTENNLEAVLQIASQLDSLRETAQKSLISTTVRDRGYFLPAEEDQVLANWGSYQQARAALHEVIESITQQENAPKRATMDQFLIAFASAILLIEAARFLRHYLAEEPAIRSKLNEAQPNLKIGKDTFEKIQRSLTDPSNALRIREARDFYELHQSEIDEAVKKHSPLAPLHELIQQRRGVLDVSTARYVKSRIRDRKEQLTDAVVQKGLAKAIYGIQQLGAIAIGSLSTSPTHQPSLPDAIAKQMALTIRRGDILVTRKENALTNYFLPGFWPHVAFSVGDGRVVESLKDGVKNRTLESTFNNDAMIVIRPLLEQKEIDLAIERSSKHVGKPYDFDFDFTRSDRMVCTEVVYRSFSGISEIEFALTKRAGRHTLSAEDLLAMALDGSKFTIAAGFHPAVTSQVLGPEEATQLVRNTIGQKQPSLTYRP